MRDDCRWTQGSFWDAGVVLKLGRGAGFAALEMCSSGLRVLNESVLQCGNCTSLKQLGPTTTQQMPQLLLWRTSLGESVVWCRQTSGLIGRRALPQPPAPHGSQQPSSPSGALGMMQQFTKSTVCPCEVKSDKSPGSGTHAFQGKKPTAAATI